MMHALSCAVVREDLEALHDGELPIEQQIAVQAHLRECVACAIEAAELDEVRRLLRVASSRRLAAADDAPLRVPTAALDRVRVERQLSWGTWLRGVFDDMHLVWPALGATVATVFCLFASMGVLQAASTTKDADSLSGIIDHLTNEAMERPLQLEGATLYPSAAMVPITDEEAVFALSAVVTREGRVQSLEMLAAEQARALKVKPEVVLAMLDAASRARFSPAQAGGAPVAVSMVWLLAHTTVRGRENDAYELLRKWEAPPLPRVRRAAPRPPVPPVVKPAPAADGLEAELGTA